MDNAEFDRAFGVRNALTDAFVRGNTFTHDQLSRLCKHVAAYDTFMLETLLESHKLDDGHIDILLYCCVLSYDVRKVFKHFKQLAPHHIEMGLQYDEASIVREAAYNHPCCTDEQKVKYLLMKNG